MGAAKMKKDAFGASFFPYIYIKELFRVGAEELKKLRSVAADGLFPRGKR